MSNEVNNGGPAFPVPIIVQQDTKTEDVFDFVGLSGMSLRDWFAGMALQGDWAAQSTAEGMWSNQVMIEILQDRAVVYYRMADAMLKQKGEK